MREIKYRAKLIDKDQWVVGYYGYKDLTDEHFIVAPTFDPTSDHRPQYFTDHLVRPETVSEFSGLKDVNDKEVYEGHIVKVVSKRDNPLIGVVKHSGGCLRIVKEAIVLGGIPLVAYKNGDLEIVGSIHDHQLNNKS